MIVFDSYRSSHESRVNFVDDDDTYVGYETHQRCCEDAGYYISDSIQEYSQLMLDNQGNKYEFDLSEYYLDRDFLLEVVNKETDEDQWDDDYDWGKPRLKEGKMLVFRLEMKKPWAPYLYLHIFNSHNGFYTHKINVKHDGEMVKDEEL